MNVEGIGKGIAAANFKPAAGIALKKESNAPKQAADAFVKGEAAFEPLKVCLENLVNPKSKVMPDVNTKQLADSYGRVKHLALMLSGYVSGDARSQVLNAYKVLFTKMEPDTKFSIVVATDRDRADVEKVIKDNNVNNPDRIEFIKPESTGNLTVWARDMMVGMYDADKSSPVILKQTPLHNWHGDDSQVPQYIADKNPGMTLDAEPRIVTDGGDVMSNTKESFVGNYSMSATAKNVAYLAGKDKALKSQILKYYENKYGKEVKETDSPVKFPYHFVPARFPGRIHRFEFHLTADERYEAPVLGENQVSEAEMFENVAKDLFEKQFGKPVTVMGADNPNTEHVEEPATDHLDMGLTPVDDKTFFVGDPTITDRIFRSMNPEELAVAADKLSEMAGRPIDPEILMANDKNRDNPDDFKEYVRILENKGYNVKRMPHSEPNWFGPYISYNNCLMERFDKDGKEFRRVFLPVYGIEKLDNFAIKRFEDEGFEVHPLPLDGLSRRWGALRCISNWLERTPEG